MASLILTLLLAISLHGAALSYGHSVADSATNSQISFRGDSLLLTTSEFSPSLLKPSDMEAVFLEVNRRLKADAKYLNKVKESMAMGDFLLDSRDYAMAIFEYQRAFFYLRSKIDNGSSNIDSLRYEVLLRKSRLHFLMGEFEKSQKIAEQIVEDYLSYESAGGGGENIVPGLRASLLIVKNFIYSQRYTLALSEIRNIYLDFDIDSGTDSTLRHLRDMAVSLSSNSIADTAKIENMEIERLFVENLKDDRYKSPRTAYRLSVIPGAGHFYAGDVRGGVGALVTNTFILAFLASRIAGIAFHAEQYFNYGRREADFNRIIVNSVDLLIVYQFLFNRYYRGAANTIADRVEQNNTQLFEVYRASVLKSYDF